MSSLNKVQLIGRLGDDPAIREVGDNLVANFNLATDESYKKDGEKVQKVEWHRIVIWGKLAEIVEKYLGKGDLIYVEGKLQTRKYEDAKTSTTKYTTEIVVFSMQMLQTQGGQKQEEPAPARQAQRGREQARPAQHTGSARPSRQARQAEIGDEDIPF